MSSESASESILLKAVSCELFGINTLPASCPFTEVRQWVDLLLLSEKQRVTAIVWNALCDAGWIPPVFPDTDDEAFLVNGMDYTTRLRWSLAVDKVKRGYLERKKILSQMLECLSDGGYECCELKGVSIADLYPSPYLRRFSDLDLFVPHRTADAEKALLEKFGGSIEYGTDNHDKMIVRNNLIEIHRNFIDERKYRSNKILNNELMNLYAEDSPTFRLCFVLHHAAKHFVADESCLLHFLDVAMLLTRYRDTLDHRAVYELTLKCGSRRFYELIIRFLEKYLHFDASYGGPEAGEVSSELLEKVYDDIFRPEHLIRSRKSQGVLALTRQFLANRWKQRLVYAADIRIGVFIRTAWYRITEKRSVR